MTLEQIALGLGIAGLGCFLWPILMRVTGKTPALPPGSGGASLRSPLWWAGFVLTILLSLTVRNIWKDGKVLRANADFSRWAAEAARTGGALVKPPMARTATG